MKQHLLTKVFMGILIVLNVSLLAFIFTQGPPRGKGPEGRKPGRGQRVPERISRILNFSPEQKEAYLEKGRSHHQRMMRLNREKDETLKEYLYILADDSKSLEQDSLLTKITQLEREKIERTYEHFSEIKDICTEEQAKNIPEVLELAFGGIFGPPKRPRP